MQVGIHASIYDEHLSEFARAIDPLLTELGSRLTGEYGGPRLGGFDAQSFGAKFQDECGSLGYMSQLTDQMRISP